MTTTQDSDRDAFQAARNALLLVRILSRLQIERGVNSWLDGVLREVENQNRYPEPVPLVNQTAFLAMLYMTALWLRESYFTDRTASNILIKHISNVVNDSSITVSYGPTAKKDIKSEPDRFARRLRNAIAHASVTINAESFVFYDENPKEKKDCVNITMPWQVVGRYTEALIAAGNELLYPELSAPTDAANSQ